MKDQNHGDDSTPHLREATDDDYIAASEFVRPMLRGPVILRFAHEDFTHEQVELIERVHGDLSRGLRRS